MPRVSLFRPIALTMALLLGLFITTRACQAQIAVNSADARNQLSDKAEPTEDPAFQQYGIYQGTARGQR